MGLFGPDKNGVEQKLKAVEKEEIVDSLRTLPKRKLSEMEKQLIFILIEKAKIERERSVLILNKGFVVFLAFLGIAYFSKIYDFIPQQFIQMLNIFGIVVLIIAAFFYMRAMSREDKILDKLLDNFIK